MYSICTLRSVLILALQYYSIINSNNNRGLNHFYMFLLHAQHPADPPATVPGTHPASSWPHISSQITNGGNGLANQGQPDP